MTPHPFGWLSLLPPIVAIVLAIATRRIVLSLILGIFAGALVMSGGDPLIAVYHTWETHLWRTLSDPGKLRIFAFTISMGAMVGVITRSGGMVDLIQIVTPYARNRRRGQLVTWLMGLLIFFDDYANTMLLGSTLRPVCDRLKISREKLAYLVDSTAAPVAGLAPLSTWVAVEIDYIANGLESIDASGLSAFGLFLSSIPYRFYIWTALFLVPLTAFLNRDFGPMLRAERNAAAGQTSSSATTESDQATTPTGNARWYNAVLPIVLTLALVIYFIYDTGSRGACNSAADAAGAATNAAGVDSVGFEDLLSRIRVAADEGDVGETRAAIGQLAEEVVAQTSDSSKELEEQFIPKLAGRDILGEANSSLALQYGSLAGLLLAGLLPMLSRSLQFDEVISSAASGARVVLPAVAILWTASAMSNMTTADSVDGVESTAYEYRDHRLYTAGYLTEILTGGDSDQPGVPSEAVVPLALLPTLVFVLAAAVAFCTGTSWGTMGILMPTVVQTANALLTQGGNGIAPNDPILLSSIGGVLAGAVFGDHCSPISDTTVLSSQSSGCNHLAHVWTQMPYALLAGCVSVLFGTLPIGFGVSVWIMAPVQLAALVLFLQVFGKRVPDELELRKT